MKLFAFGHRRYVGKDTAARFLINHIRLDFGGIQVQKITFATKMKQICYELFGHLGLQTICYYEDHPTEKEIIIPAIGLSARDLWIRFGNIMRGFYNDVWIDYALNTITAPIGLVTDLRYPNEALAIKKHNGILIRIDRECVPIYGDEADSALADYTDWDYIVLNNNSLTDLHKQIIDIVNKEMK